MCDYWEQLCHCKSAIDYGLNPKGENATIGNFVTILDDSIVPAGIEIPEKTIYGGKPAKFIRVAAEMHEFEIQ